MKQTVKTFKSDRYNFVFNYETGELARWGTSTADDPLFSPYGPEIADIEVSTVCSGIKNKVCSFCYKSNTPVGENMSFEIYKTIVDKIPQTLTSVAFGVGTFSANKDIIEMFKYNKAKNIVNNITVNGELSDRDYDILSTYCSAVAVSRYTPKDVCYDAIAELSNTAVKQITIHQLVAKETINDIFELFDDIKNDERLSKSRLHSVVLLAAKPTQRGTSCTMTPVWDVDVYQQIVMKAIDQGIQLGFDSCTGPIIANLAVKTNNLHWLEMIESCESTRFSIYINVHGNVYPCSFAEQCMQNGISLVDKEFNDVWFSQNVNTFRECLTKQTCKRDKSIALCPLFSSLYDGDTQTFVEGK